MSAVFQYKNAPAEFYTLPGFKASSHNGMTGSNYKIVG